MKKVKLTTVVLASLFALNSCQKDESSIIDDEEVSVTDEVQEPELEITAEVLETLENNFFNTSDIAVVDSELPDGTTEQAFLVDGDIIMSAEEIEELPKAKKENETDRHFRSLSLVTGLPRNITVLGRTGGSRGLSSEEQVALRNALRQYNALNLSIKFFLKFSSTESSSGYDTYVYHDPDIITQIGRFQAFATLPRNGNPGPTIRVMTSNTRLTSEVMERLFAHEIGHTIGLRHVDWDTKASCSDRDTRPSDSGVHIEIPGTISGFDASSVMVSCLTRATNGKFSGDDKKALRFLY